MATWIKKHSQAHVQHQRASLPEAVVARQSAACSRIIRQSATAYHVNDKRTVLRVSISPTSAANIAVKTITAQRSPSPSIVSQNPVLYNSSELKVKTKVTTKNTEE
jgi:hypothetical protein